MTKTRSRLNPSKRKNNKRYGNAFSKIGQIGYDLLQALESRGYEVDQQSGGLDRYFIRERISNTYLATLNKLRDHSSQVKIFYDSENMNQIDYALSLRNYLRDNRIEYKEPDKREVKEKLKENFSGVLNSKDKLENILRKL